jgi:tRNA (cmo5U34)-methyltransferase
MSASAPGAHWQRDELVSSFLDRREVLLPLIELQEDVVKRVIERHPRAVERFLDLGCGDGAMAALAFGVSPDAHGVLVDNSEPMLARAHERLTGARVRWETLRADLAGPDWRELLPVGRFDLVVSGLAIHHLPSARKRELFAELHELLEPGGLFVNMDYVTVAGPLRGLFDEDMRAKALDDEHAHGGTRTAEEVDLEDDHDLPDTVLEQLQWLGQAGFTDTEIHFKWAEAAIFGGTRPEGDS